MAAPTLYTRADLRERLANRYEGVPWWATADADDALNEALLLWNLLTGQWRTTVALPAIAATWDYDLTQALVFGARVTYNNQPLDVSALWELEQGRPGWRSETTASGGDVPTKPMVWAPVSLLYIHVWPSVATTTGTFLVEGVAATPQLLTDEQTVDLTEDLLTPILDGALHICAFSEGSDRFVATQAQWLRFLGAAVTHNSQLKSSAVMRRYLGLDRGRDLRPTKGAPVYPGPMLSGGA
jgi:hypothetical protein